jgi:hypothetical protein
MNTAYRRCVLGRARALPILVGLIGALLVSCASGASTQLLGTWRLLRANGGVPEACSDATLTFHRDGTFEGTSGALKTHGRYVTTGRKNNYRLKFEQLEYSGAENCQGFTARDMQANNVDVLDLEFIRDGLDFRLSTPLASDLSIVYTRAN